MKQPETKKRHRAIISHYAGLICDYVIESKALNQTALKFDVKGSTVKGIIENNEKYFKTKRSELSKCKIKIKKL